MTDAKTGPSCQNWKYITNTNYNRVQPNEGQKDAYLPMSTKRVSESLSIKKKKIPLPCGHKDLVIPTSYLL